MSTKEKDIAELQENIKKFCEEREWDKFHNPKDLAIGISTEANELLDIFRFKTEEDIIEIFNNPNKKIKIEEEVADVLFFVLRFAQMNNIDLNKALSNKMELNAKKYPTELVKGSNKKYNEY